MTQIDHFPPPLSIRAFCERQQVSRASYYSLVAKGEGPRTYRIGHLVRISAEAEAAWVKEREHAALKGNDVAGNAD